MYCNGLVSEEDIKEVLIYFKVEKATPFKPTRMPSDYHFTLEEILEWQQKNLKN